MIVSFRESPLNSEVLNFASSLIEIGKHDKRTIKIALTKPPKGVCILLEALESNILSLSFDALTFFYEFHKKGVVI